MGRSKKKRKGRKEKKKDIKRLSKEGGLRKSQKEKLLETISP